MTAVTFRQWLHWILFRKEHHELLHLRADLAAIDWRYSAKVASLWRTPHVDSPWMDKFLSLEKDYQALEKEVGEARIEAMIARRQMKKLMDLIV